MAFTFSITSGAAIAKAGLRVNSGAAFVKSTGLSTRTRIEEFSDQAEGLIIMDSRRNWLTKYSNLASGQKWLLQRVSASLMAIDLVNLDDSNYFVGEADQIKNVNDDIATKGLGILKNFKSNEIKDP